MNSENEELVNGVQETDSLDSNTLTPKEEIKKENDYFDDDLDFLEVSDETIFSSNDTGIFKQDENIISWEIINLYKDNGNPRGKNSLKSQPPILRVSTNKGDSVDFMMTKDFTQTLNKALTDANKAFYGVQPDSSKKNLKEKAEGYKEWVKENKIKSIALGLIISVLLVLAFI